MKLLLLSDLHAGESRESSTHPGIIRQANTETLEVLTTLMPHFKEMNVDAVIQMGDVIRDKDRETDLEHFDMVFSQLSTLAIPVFPILGNHDAVNVSRAEISDLLRKKQLDTDFFGVTNIENIQLIWLDYAVNENGEVVIPHETLRIVEPQLHTGSRKIVFTHYSLVQKDMRSNFYFGGSNSTAAIVNIPEVFNFLQTHSIQLVISGHDHWCSVKHDNGIHFVTAPSFSENITMSANSNQCPGIYSVLETTTSGVTIDSFSGQFSFFHLELSF